MEFVVLRTSGLANPAVISVRSGSIRKQSTIPSSHPFRLPLYPWPVHLEACLWAGSSKSSSSSLPSLDENGHCKVPLTSRDGCPMSITFRVTDRQPQASNSSNKEEADCPPALLEEKDRKTKEIQGFLEKHAIPDFMRGLMLTLVRDQPGDPYGFIAQKLKEAAIMFDSKDTAAESNAEELPAEQGQAGVCGPGEELTTTGNAAPTLPDVSCSHQPPIESAGEVPVPKQADYCRQDDELETSVRCNRLQEYTAPSLPDRPLSHRSPTSEVQHTLKESASPSNAAHPEHAQQYSEEHPWTTSLHANGQEEVQLRSDSSLGAEVHPHQPSEPEADRMSSFSSECDPTTPRLSQFMPTSWEAPEYSDQDDGPTPRLSQFVPLQDEFYSETQDANFSATCTPRLSRFVPDSWEASQSSG
mmetsp:Transcript_126675/g.370116  ORF Transcript_126675/g.370116 Transcript_126675/m.370116 type:complete len:415 (-) Transcript_126675:187-1431(-)